MALVTGDGFGYSKCIRISYAASMGEIDEALAEVRELRAPSLYTPSWGAVFSCSAAQFVVGVLGAFTP